MLQSTNLYHEAQRRLLELNKARKEVEYRLSRAPHGTIHIVNSHGRIQFYRRMRKSETLSHSRFPQAGNSQPGRSKSPKAKQVQSPPSSQHPNMPVKTDTYLSPQKDRAIIQSLLRKRYDEKILFRLQIEIANLTAFLSKSENIVENLQTIYSASPAQVKQFLNPLDLSDTDYISQWLSIPFEPKTISENVKAQQTEQGEYVRSKSELSIANALYRNHIPYKYECPLRLSTGGIIYPDFTVLNVRQRKEMYWEHRGMMDDRSYALHSVSRMKDYVKSGYVFGQDIIITEETSASPLGTAEIECVIRDFLL